MNNSGPRVKVSGPNTTKPKDGIGFGAETFKVTGENLGHKREFRGPNVDFEASLQPNKGRFSFQANLFDFSHTTRGGTKFSYSKGFGGEVGFQDDPVAKRTQLTFAPFGKGKAGISFSASHEQIENFGRNFQQTLDREF